MGLLFYCSSEEGEDGRRCPGGGAGTKAIYVNGEKLLRCFDELYSVQDGSKSRDEVLEVAVASLVEGRKDDVFAEEYHHFQIVRASSVGRLLYFWNPLLRVAFTAQNHGVADWTNLRSCPLYHSAVDYFSAYVAFYYCAAPLLECAYSIEREYRKEGSLSESFFNNPDDAKESVYLAPLRVGMQYLKGCVESQKAWHPEEKNFDKKVIAQVIDDSFLACGDFSSWDGVPVYSRNPQAVSLPQLMLRHKIYWPIVSAPRSWLVFAKNVIKMVPYGISWLASERRSARKGGASQEAVMDLPGVWSPLGAIDPVAFLSGRRDMGSHELSFADRRDKALSDTFWYALERSVCIPFFLDRGWSPDTIMRYLDNSWAFLLRGKVSGGRDLYSDVAVLLHYIDEILFEVNELHARDLDAVERAVIAFKELVAPIDRFFGKDIAPFASAINMGYLHI